MNGLILNGVAAKADIEVIDGRDTNPKLWWDPKATPKNCRARTMPARAFVVHHQAGEGQAVQCWNVLNKRPDPKRPGHFFYLSVHFEIDQAGVITQYADLDTVCQHASDANDWTIGVEIASLGTGKTSKRWPRNSYQDTMHGAKTTFLALYPEQLDSALRLTKAVCKVLGIPTLVPMAPDGKALRRVMTDQELAGWSGILSHYTLTDNKPDVDPRTMDFLLKNLAGKLHPTK